MSMKRQNNIKETQEKSEGNQSNYYATLFCSDIKKNVPNKCDSLQMIIIFTFIF